MPTIDELTPCPGCDQPIHPNARECPKCGFTSEPARMDELLAGLGTISSILIGFSLAGLVEFASMDSRADWTLQGTIGVLLFASMLLLSLLIGVEFLRRQEICGGRVNPSREEKERLWNRTGWLLSCFCLALLCTAGAVVLLGFHFSLVHGFAAIAALVLSLLVFRFMK